MAELKDIELFEEWSKGALSDSDVAAFENRIKTDKEFAENYRRYEQVIADIQQQQSYEELMAQLQEVHKAKDWSAPTSEILNSNKQSFGWLFWLLAVIAAAIIAFFVARSFYSFPNASQSINPQKVEAELPAAEQTVADPDTVAAIVEEPEVDAEVVGLEQNPSAFMISEAGYFVTQYSEIKTARSVRLRQNDSTEYKVEVLLNDPELDVAVLRLSEGAWSRSSRLPYRLASTQAFASTEVMAVARSGQLEFGLGHIKTLDSDGDRDFYSVELEDFKPISGGVLLSRNGNVVSFIRSTNDSLQFLKSTELVGLLARHASDADMTDYLPAADNRLAGFEREVQREKMEPFVLEVIRFY